MTEISSEPTGEGFLLDAVLGTHPSITLPSSSNSTQDSVPTKPEGFFPQEPVSLEETGLGASSVESLILKFLLHRGPNAGRSVAEGIHLPRRVVTETLDRMRDEMLVSLKSSAGVGDYVYEMTETGHSRAQRYSQTCKYVGPAPVPFGAYLESVAEQTLKNAKLDVVSLCKAFAELMIQPERISQLGQALNAGRGLFLYGPPGNGKTSIAERVIGAFSKHIWIPHIISINGDLVRLYDPSNHVEIESPGSEQWKHDKRWICIERPTIIVGGELTLDLLDLRFNPHTGISEAPVQMKANCGAFVIDDFGRQRVSSMDLLNRLIVPLEKSFDYLNLPSGRQIEVPFEQLLVFSTNLSPKDLVDEAFLRRIPYKIEISNATESEFRKLFEKLSPAMRLEYNADAIDYLISTYYEPQSRPFRFCHPRDLLRQIKNLCEFHETEPVLSSENFDIAIRNYFAEL